MLRSLSLRTGGAFARSSSRNLSVRQNPSTTTSVLLSRLSPTLVESKLKEDLTGINCRKVQLEPGCSLHFANECEANVAAKFVQSKFNLETIVSRASMPCLTLQNIPEDVSVEGLKQSFSGHNPGAVRVSGAGTFLVKVRGDGDAWKALTAIRSVSVNGQQLQASSTKVDSHNHMISIYNVPAGADSAAVKTAVSDALKKADLAKVASVQSVSTFAKPTVTLRYSADKDWSVESLREALGKDASKAYAVSEPSYLPKPALFVRNIAHLEDQSLDTLLGAHKKHVERVHIQRAAADKLPNMAVVYFDNEEHAFACAAQLHNSVVEGRRVSAAYREVSEPAVEISNIPEDTTREELEAFSGRLEYVRMDFTPGEDTATVVLGTPKQARIAKQYYHNMEFGDNVLEAEVAELGDVGFVVSSTGADSSSVTPSAIAAALKGLPVQPKSMSFQTKATAEVGFFSVDEAHKALDRFVSGDLKLPASSKSAARAGSMVASSISALPTYVLQVLGLSPDTPVKAVTDEVAASVPGSSVLRADRSALLKFRKHSDVVPGLKQLKSVQVDGQHVKVGRYRPLQQQGDSAYDEATGEVLKAQAAADKFSLISVTKDFMHLDPASRYQIAKNAFNRALFDARATKNMGLLFDTTLTKEAQREVKDLFTKTGSAVGMDDADINRRLFQLFIQKEEMMRYSSDFQDITTLQGHADESSAFNWSQFDVNSDADIDRLMKEMRQADQEAVDDMVNQARKGQFAAAGEDDEEEGASGSSSDSDSDSDAEGSSSSSDSSSDEESDAEDAEKAASSKNSKKKKMLNFRDEQGNVLNLTTNSDGDMVDTSGNIWSMLVINTDTTQKTMPGNRVLSHRTLVMMGNLKGSGGFGMGKGKTPADSLTAACRAAMRNLLHIDLYDNFGLAHDLYGKHNSCHVYIRATPAAREMVASKMAEEVLNRFGISSASVKIVGNRNPYSQINAIFNALSHHENIDEFAKDRGQRYLSLRWAYDKGI